MYNSSCIILDYKTLNSTSKIIFCKTIVFITIQIKNKYVIEFYKKFILGFYGRSCTTSQPKISRDLFIMEYYNNCKHLEFFYQTNLITQFGFILIS